MYEDCDESVPVRCAPDIETPTTDSESLSPPWTRKTPSTGTGSSAGGAPARKLAGRAVKPPAASGGARDLSPLPDRLSKPIAHYSEDDSSDDFGLDYDRYGEEDDAKVDDIALSDTAGRLLRKGVAQVDIRKQEEGNLSGRRGGSTAYDPAIDGYLCDDLDISEDVRALFHHITAYEVRELDIDYRLKVFIPKYYPAAGDVDALLKVAIPSSSWDVMPHPAKPCVLPESLARLGIVRLDEPSGEQSSPALLHMRLKDEVGRPGTAGGGGAPTAIAHSARDIDKWIDEVGRLRTARITERGHTPCPVLPSGDPDRHLGPFPASVRQALDRVGAGVRGNAFPSPAALDCPLSTYARVVCALLDIPVEQPAGLKELMKALHVLFSVYSCLKNEHEYYAA